MVTVGPDVAVIGAGPIGLAIAWRCATRGIRVTVYDPEPGAGRSTRAGWSPPCGSRCNGPA